MIKDIDDIIKNHIPPYLYNSINFKPGETPIYYSGPYWDSEEISAAINSILNGKWITAGEEVYKFQKEFSKKFNVKHSFMVNSGSSANLLLIAALKLKYKWDDNDEIIVSPVGFPTTISVIIQNNLKPVFVDIELDTLNFDIDLIEEKITAKTRGIFVSPVLGNPPNMDELLRICKKYNIKLIGDNCDSLGSKWNDKFIHEYYVAFSNSFYPAHHISTGEGGMICTNDDEINSIVNSLAWWGRDCHCNGSQNLLSNGMCKNRFSNWLPNYDGIIDHKYVFTTMGYNLKPLDLQGAIGLAQLNKFDDISKKRKYSKNKLYNIFFNKFKNDEIYEISTYVNSDVCWFGTPIRCKNKTIKQKLVKYLEDNKIQTRNYFAGNILLHPGYSHLDDYKLYKNANAVLDFIFFIGAAPHYTDEIFNYIKLKLNEFTL